MLINNNKVCKVRMGGITDVMEILSGKWKFHILGTLIDDGKLRFTDLQREVYGIGSKMLSKELQDLEINKLITRTLKNTKPYYSRILNYCLRKNLRTYY